MKGPAPFPGAADPARFRWLTVHPVVAARERTLLGHVEWSPRGRAPFLEIGAGDGANLANLAALSSRTDAVAEPASRHAPDGSPRGERGEGRAPLLGLDTALEKLRFAARALPGARFLAGDAAALPFADGALGGALLRDVLHHVPDRRAVLAEAARVLAEGAPLTILEANGEAVLARVFSRLFAHERGLRESTFERVRADLGSVQHLAIERAERIEPSPFYRLLFHHRFGLPSLGSSPAAVSASRAVERLWATLGGSGSYLLFVARKR